MNFNFSEVKDIGKGTIRALIGMEAPAITKGILIEMLAQSIVYKDYKGQITTALVEKLVQDDTTLWSLIEPRNYDRVKGIIREYVGDIRWFSAGWVIDAIKKDYPALASQMEGWPKAYEWLSRQLEEARQQMQS